MILDEVCNLSPLFFLESSELSVMEDELEMMFQKPEDEDDLTFLNIN